jgi:predicted aspartyl protease
MKTPYDTTHDPAIPTLPVLFGHSGERPWNGPFQAIIDTGADITIVPETVAKQVKAVPLNPGQLESQWGDIHPITIYLLDIELADQILPGVVVAGDPYADEIILGRNVLNKLALFLDGPQQQTDILDEAAANLLRTPRRK